MDTKMIIDIISIVLYVIIGGIALYYKSNTKLNKRVNDLIDRAELLYADSTNAGGQKFSWVVDKLYGLIPAPVRLIIPKAIVETIVQNTFDSMENYAKKQLDKASSKITEIK